jgi:hypothetical protein
MILHRKLETNVYKREKLMNTKYLTSIFDKCKKEGHFNKFETAEDFLGYFKDTESFTKLWNFLRSKEYKVPELDAFIEKATGQNVESAVLSLPVADCLPEFLFRL